LPFPSAEQRLADQAGEEATFTTLGYGDLTPNESWRLLASFEAANGIIIFGWTTALIVAFVHRVAGHETAAEPSDADS